ncbi:hypothetical protein ACROYT_G008001 [Oculina patagonica]
MMGRRKEERRLADPVSKMADGLMAVLLFLASFLTSQASATPGNSANSTPVSSTATKHCNNVYNSFYAGPNKKIETILHEKKEQLNYVEAMKNCAELYKSGEKISGVYIIDPDGSGAFDVFCDQTTAGGGWTVFQKRLDGSVDFYRDWAYYKRGFGNLNGEFWLGLDKINRLTKTKNRLRVDLEDTAGKTAYAEYDMFAVTSEKTKYQLSLGSYSLTGTAGDSLSRHLGQPFSTKDQDNDISSGDCAKEAKGAWWYVDCRSSNLNGSRCSLLFLALFVTSQTLAKPGNSANSIPVSSTATKRCNNVYNSFYAGPNKKIETILQEMKKQLTQVQDDINTLKGSKPPVKGTAGDSLSRHRGAPFSTKDQDNDTHTSVNCAVARKGAWWYEACNDSNLNGLYHFGKHSSDNDGVNWDHWKGSKYSAKRAEMKIRPVHF